MMPKVSICVPVYNVEDCIERCVSSLMRQTYPNIEYVFVNDATPDSSMEVLRSVVNDYPDRLEQTHIISNDRNRGLAYTRKVSVMNASGEYVICCDSDDYMPLNAVQVLVEKAEETGADIVCGAKIFDKYGSQTVIDTYRPVAGTYLEDALSDRLASLWGKIYRRELFLTTPMFAPEGMDYLEDRIVCLYMGGLAKKIESVEDTVYYYVYRESSISAVRNEKLFRCTLRYWQLAEEYLESRGEKEKYKELCARIKTGDKAQLLLHSSNNAVRKPFADIFPEETEQYKHLLKRGPRLMLELCSRHLWGLVALYQLYINIRKVCSKAGILEKKNK